MSISGVRAVSGRANYKTLHSGLSEYEYNVHKAYAWFGMLQDGRKPTKWYKPNKQGTKVNFDFLQSQLDFKTAMGEFRGYVDGLNELYPDLKMTIEDGDAE